VTFKPAADEAYSVCFEWEIPERGHIHISGDSSAAVLDMHAEWSVLSELLEWLVERDPNIIVGDLSEGNYHNLESFNRFMNAQHDEGEEVD